MAQSSLGWNDDEEEQDYEADRLPMNAEDRASTDLQSPAFQKPAEDEPAPAVDIPPPQPLGNTVLPDTPEPILHQRRVGDRAEARVQAQDQKLEAVQRREHEQAVKKAGVVAVADDGSPVFKPGTGAPEQTPDGRWVRETRDTTGNRALVDMRDPALSTSKRIKIDRATGDSYFDEGGMRVVTGKDQATVNRINLLTERKRLQAENSMDLAMLASERQALTESKAKLKQFGSTPETYETKTRNLGLAIAGKSADSPEVRQYNKAAEQWAEWQRANPEFRKQKAEFDAADANVTSREAAVMARRIRAAALMGNGTGAAIAGTVGDVGIQPIIRGEDADAKSFTAWSTLQAVQSNTPVEQAHAANLAALKEKGVLTVGGRPIDEEIARLATVAETKAAQPSTPSKRFFSFGDTISGIWDALSGLGTTATAAFYQLTEGMERPDKYSPAAKEAFAKADSRSKEMQAKTSERQAKGESTSVGESFREAGDSLGFSAATMAAAIPAGIAGGKVGGALGLLGGPAAEITVPAGAVIGGVGASMIASGSAAYRMAGATFLSEQFEALESESVRKSGRPMNEEEKQSAYEALLPIAKNTALWEAGPEAVANAVTLGAGKIIFGLGKPLVSKFAGSAAGKIGAGLASVGTELATETVTQVEQNADQRKGQAYLEGRPMEPEQADWSAQGVKQAFKEVAPQTLAMLGIMGGAGGAVKGGSKLFQRWSAPPEPAADATDFASASAAYDDAVAKAQTALDNNDPAGHAEQMEMAKSALESAAFTGFKFRSAIPSVARKTLAKIADPEGDVENVELLLANDPATFFATNEIGSNLRDVYLGPERESRVTGIARALGVPPAAASLIVDQHIAFSAARDLQKVLDGQRLDPAREQALAEIGLIDVLEDGSIAVTDDATPLLPKATREALKADPDSFGPRYSVTPDATGNGWAALVTAGRQRLGETFSAVATVQATPAGTPAQAPEATDGLDAIVPPNVEQPPADVQPGTGEQRETGSEGASATEVEPTAEQPQASASAQPLIDEFVQRYGKQFTGGVVIDTEQERGSGGVAISRDGKQFQVYTRDLEASLSAVPAEQREKLVRTMLDEELRHLADIRVNSDAETAALWESLPKPIEDATQAIYTRERGQSDPLTGKMDAVAWGREYKRLLSQETETGQTSELATATMEEIAKGGDKTWVGRLLVHLRKMIGWLKSHDASNTQLRKLHDELVRIRSNPAPISGGAPRAEPSVRSIWPELTEREAKDAETGPFTQAIRQKYDSLSQERRQAIDQWFEENETALNRKEQSAWINDRLGRLRRYAADQSPSDFAALLVDTLRDINGRVLPRDRATVATQFFAEAGGIASAAGLDVNEIKQNVRAELGSIYGADAKEMAGAIFGEIGKGNALSASSPALPKYKSLWVDRSGNAKGVMREQGHADIIKDLPNKSPVGMTRARVQGDTLYLETSSSSLTSGQRKFADRFAADHSLVVRTNDRAILDHRQDAPKESELLFSGAPRKQPAMPQDNAASPQNAQPSPTSGSRAREFNGGTVRLYHRGVDRGTGGSFYADRDIGESYGPQIHVVDVTINKPARDKDVISAAKVLGLHKRGARAYEYFSPNLMDAFVRGQDVDALIEELKDRGFDGAYVSDFDVPFSWIPFESSQVQPASQGNPNLRAPDQGALSASSTVNTGGNWTQQAILPMTMTPSGNAMPIDVSERHRLHRLAAIAWESAADVLERSQNPIAQSLGRKLADYTDTKAAVIGHLESRFEKILAGQSRADLKKAKEEFKSYFKARENKNKQLAASLRAGMSPLAKQIVSTWEKVAVDTGKKAQALNIQVWDAALNDSKGGYRLIGNLGTEYFPRQMRTEVWDVIDDPDSNPKLRRKLEDALVRSGWDPAKARAFFELDAPKLFDRNDFFAALEMARKVQLPEDFYEYEFDKVVPSYIERFSQRASQIRHFGQKLNHLPLTDPKNTDYFDKALKEAANGMTRDYIDAVRKQVYGVRERGIGWKGLSTLRVLASGILLSNPFTTVPRNVISGLFSTAEQLGAGRSLAALKNILKGTVPKLDAVNLGVIRGAMLDATQYVDPELDVSGVVRKITGKLLKASGYNASEEFLRWHSAATGMVYVQDYLRANQNSAMAKEAEAFMQRMNIDPAKIRLEAGNFKDGQETRRFLRTAVRETQFGYDVAQVPLWANSPLGRLFYQFGRWGTQRTRALWRHVFEPAIFGQWKNVNGRRFRVRNFNGMARLLTTLPLRTAVTAGGVIMTGEMFGAMAALFFDRDRDDASLEELAKTWDRSKMKALAKASERAINDIMMGGMLGILSQPLDWYRSWFGGGRPKNPIEPPVSAVPKSLSDLVMSMTERGTPINFADFKAGWLSDANRAVGSMLPGQRATVNVATNLAAKLGLHVRAVEIMEAERQVANLRKAANRFGKEQGFESGGNMGFKRFPKKPTTATYDRVQDNLLIGNFAEARKAADEYLDSLPAEDRVKAERSMKASVKMREPIRVGTHHSAEVKRDFLSWARENLSEKQVQEIEAIQSTYVDAARMAGF